MRKACKGLDAEIIVVDNASLDGSVDLVAEKFPEVKLIANQQNVGFSKANNQGIRISNAEYVLLLNPDTIVEEDTFVKCCDFMDAHPEAGGLGVKMLDGKGDFLPESKRGLPTPMVAFYKVFGLASLLPKSRRFGRYHLGFLSEDETNEIEVLSGAYMLMRKTALDKVGLLDEDYFMYGEDIDLSYRIIKGGFKNYYFPETRIIHYKGESTKKTSINYVFIFYRAMIIFAKKHFSQNNAVLFSLLINIAIYLRAGFEIAKNFIRRTWLTVLDATILFGGMALLKDYWTLYFKQVKYFYPENYSTQIIPSYILIWLISIYFSGGNDRPFNLYRILRGVFVGLIIISTISNFVESYRFSKGLLLLDSVLVAFEFIFVRLLLNLYRFGRLQLHEEVPKRIILAGRENESKRVAKLIAEATIKADIIGFVSTEKHVEKTSFCLGKLEQLAPFISLYKANEVIFCSKDIRANQIIEMMSLINSTKVDFKIVPDDTNYVIGSSSKNTNGTVYTVDVHFNLNENYGVRNKRLLDICISALLILISPLFLLWMRDYINLYKNLFSVFWGTKSMVGFANRNPTSFGHIRPGIITPSTHLKHDFLEPDVIRKMDLLYAKDYNVALDMEIVLRNFTHLDAKSPY